MVRESKPSPQPRSLPRTQTAGADRFSRRKRILINTFLIFHMVAITCWCVPITTPFTVPCKDFIRPYFLWSGLFQSWDMFAPSPKTINSYVEAIVLYEDGNTRNWAFPRMEHLSLTDRYFKERYRKYVENLKEDKNAALWPDAARFIARLNNNRPIPIRMVLLVRYWSDIVLPTNGAYHPASWDSHVFYGYPVKPEDLK